MPSKNPAQRLRDILDNLDNTDAIEEFTAQLDFSGFRTDRKTVYAVVRALDIVSETSRRLPPALIGRHPEVDWAAVAASGNVYRHEYDEVDEALIWPTVKHELPPLRVVAAEEFDRWRSAT